MTLCPSLHPILTRALGQLTLAEAGIDGTALTQAPAAWGPAAQVQELVQSEFAAVDGGRLRFQGDEELLCILSGHQASLRMRGQGEGDGVLEAVTPKMFA